VYYSRILRDVSFSTPAPVFDGEEVRSVIGRGISGDLLSLVAALFDRRISRYDLVLAAIPLAFLLAGAAGLTLSIPPRLALAGAAGVGAVAVVESLFINPPIRS
jgi:hypothetical protein